MPPKVLLIGGLGFIGYHAARALRQSGFNVTIGNRTATNAVSNEFPVVLIDLHKMSDADLSDILRPFEIVVFAGGADDRTMPKEDAATYFERENALPCVRIAQIGKQLSLLKIIILGSYFTHFNRTRPEWKMAERHPYVRSRVLQHERTMEAAGPGIQVITLELPYIFGSAPGKIPLWKPLVDYIRRMPIVLYTHGGTNMIPVEDVARAITGAARYTGPINQFPVGGQNLTWKEMITLIATALGKKRRIIPVPTFAVKGFAWIARAYMGMTDKQSGLDIYHFIDTQTANTYMNCGESQRELGYGAGDIAQAIRDTVEASQNKVNG